MSPVVIRRTIPTDAPSPIDQIAQATVELLLLAAEVKNVALRALIRRAGDALALIEGDDATSQVFASRARHHAERAVRVPAGRKRA